MTIHIPIWILIILGIPFGIICLIAMIVGFIFLWQFRKGINW